MRGTTPIFPVDPLNNFSVSFQVSVQFDHGPGVQAISLISSKPAAGSIAVVSGWGTLSSGGSTLPSQLQAVEVDITSRTTCNSAYASYGGITVNMICAGVTGGGKTISRLILPSPLVVGGQQAGIVSWGVGCLDARYPGVYSNNATLRSFVTQDSGVQ